MTTLTLRRETGRTIVLDVLLCIAVVAIPSLSHAATFPFYMFDPMRLLVFAALLFSSRRNALLMALWLPLLSTLTSGHPVFPKFMLIQAELALNVIIFGVLFVNERRFVPAAAVSIVASKAFYYLVKFILVKVALLDGAVVSTPWTYQAASLLLVVVCGSLVCGFRDPCPD